MAVVLRLGGLLLLFSTITWLIAPQYMHWASMPVPAWLRWAGVFCGLSCSALMHWILSSLGKNLTDTVVIRPNATLVTRGPYRWVRHPFYVTTAMVMASATLLSANWLIGAGSVLVLSLLVLRTTAEEQQLIERFGQQYNEYAATTGRFFPRIDLRGSRRS